MLTSIEVYSSWSTAPDLPLALGGREADDPLHIRDITGLQPVKANVSTRPYGSLDGEFYTGSIIGKRNIVMTIGFNPDYIYETVASLREKLYGYFMPKQPVSLRIFRDNGPTVDILGYVEGCEPVIFAKDPEMQVSIICPMPDFISAGVSVLTGHATSTPVAVEFTVLGNVVSPILFEMTAETGEEAYDGPVSLIHHTLIGLDLSTFTVNATIAPGISLLLNSERGKKTVENVVTVTGEKTNLLQTLTDTSVWPVVVPGTNRFNVSIESPVEKLWTLTYYERFGGL